MSVPREPAARLAYRVSEVAVMLGVSRTLAYEWVEKGYLPSIRREGIILVPRAELDAWLASETRRSAV